MAKVSYQWRWFTHLLHDLSTTQVVRDLAKQLPVQRWSVSGGWVVVAIGSTALLYWNGKLVVATGVGVAIMMLVYLLHDWKLELPLAQFNRLLSGWQQPLVLAVGAGGVATFITYLSASIWVDAGSPWIASGAILQDMGTLSVLVLLVWQMLNRQQQRERVTYNQWLADLTHEDPLRRLVAVRQLTSLVPAMHHDLQRRRELADYFRLLASREQEVIVREATLEGLQSLTQRYALKPGVQPAIGSSATDWAMDPIVMRRKPTRARRSLPVR